MRLFEVMGHFIFQRQKLGNMFDHDDDASADLTFDDDAYEYVEEEIEN
jgi:hypothetical protein